MRIDILTLFPEMFAPLRESIIKRAIDAGALQINYHNFRDYTKNKQKMVDDALFGGGAGMLLTAQPIVDCIEAIDPDRKSHRIYMSPAAPTLTQEKVRELAQHEWLIVLCGHYEGVDQRAIDLCIDECVSIGEYVLTGGELPAMVVIDCVARHVKGVIKEDSAANESYSHGKNWEHPQYTRPREYRGLEVPEILLSGNHKKINEWREKSARGVTPPAPPRRGDHD